MSRQREWNTIWDKKYKRYSEYKDLHVSAGFDDLSYAEWEKLTQFFIKKTNFQKTDDVLEVGCGSGAFLKELDVNSLSGIDFSKDAISKINSILKGNFKVSEATKIPFNNHSFDTVFSFSVFFYFNDYDYAQKVIDEMYRVLKPGGKLFIGEVSDIDKKEIAEKLRTESDNQREKHRVSKKKVDHLYYPLTFFKEIAKKKNMDIEIINQDIPELNFYYNAPYRFSLIMTKQGNS